MCRGKPKEKWAAHPARVRRFGIRKELVGRAGGLRPDARILQGVDEDGKGDVPCAENCGWMVPI